MWVASFAFAMVLVVVLVAVMSIDPLIWLALAIACGALCLAVAKSNMKSSATKWALAVSGSLGIVALVLSVHVLRFVEMEVTGPQRDATRVANSIDALLLSADPQRFSKSLALVESLKGDRRQSMALDLHYRLARLDGSETLAASEIVAAQSAARLANICPEFVPAALVRQMEPADLLATVRSAPDRYACITQDQQLIRLAIQRCSGPWAGRCGSELPRDALIAESRILTVADPQRPNVAVGVLTIRARAFRELINAVWPDQRLD